MKLAYITRVRLPSQSAQSVQILSMANSFSRILGDKFRLISNSPTCVNQQTDEYQHVNWLSYKCNSLDVFNTLWFALLAVKVCIRAPDTIVFSRDIVVALFVVALKRVAVYEAHSEPRTKLSAFLFRLASKSKYLRLVCISNVLKEYYVANYGISEMSALSIHDGVSFNEYLDLLSLSKSELRSSLGLPLEKLVIAHTGSPSKGGIDLLAPLLLRDKDKIHFVHVGGTKEAILQLTQQLLDMGVSNIDFREHLPRSEVRKIQVAADVLYYGVSKEWSSYWCTSPLKIFEYMATGVPILATRFGSISEVLNSSNSYCFDPQSEQSLLSAWDAICSDSKVSSARALVAQREAEQVYSWDSRAQKILDFISRRSTV